MNCSNNPLCETVCPFESTPEKQAACIKRQTCFSNASKYHEIHRTCENGTYFKPKPYTFENHTKVNNNVCQESNTDSCTTCSL